MIISLINHTDLPDVDVQQAIRAVNVQSSRTFIPIGASARRCGSTEGSARIRTSTISRRVCAATQILYLEDTIDKDDLLGFHNLHFSGIPFGFV